MPPRPPQGVVVVHGDGREEPVELVYAGTRRGLHRWIAAHPVRHAGPVQIRVERPVEGACLAVDVIDHVPPVPRPR